MNRASLVCCFVLACLATGPAIANSHTLRCIDLVVLGEPGEGATPYCDRLQVEVGNVYNSGGRKIATALFGTHLVNECDANGYISTGIMGTSGAISTLHSRPGGVHDSHVLQYILNNQTNVWTLLVGGVEAPDKIGGGVMLVRPGACVDGERTIELEDEGPTFAEAINGTVSSWSSDEEEDD